MSWLNKLRGIQDEPGGHGDAELDTEKAAAEGGDKLLATTALKVTSGDARAATSAQDGGYDRNRKEEET